MGISIGVGMVEVWRKGGGLGTEERMFENMGLFKCWVGLITYLVTAIIVFATVMSPGWGQSTELQSHTLSSFN